MPITSFWCQCFWRPLTAREPLVKVKSSFRQFSGGNLRTRSLEHQPERASNLILSKDLGWGGSTQAKGRGCVWSRLETILACRRPPPASRKSLDLLNFSKLPRKFLGDFPGTSLGVDFEQSRGSAEVSGLPRKLPGPPQRSNPSPREAWHPLMTHKNFLGVHSLNLEHEMSIGVLANLRREFANFKREFATFKRKLAEICRL